MTLGQDNATQNTTKPVRICQGLTTLQLSLYHKLTW